MKLVKLAVIFLTALNLSSCAQFPPLHPHIIAKDKNGVLFCGEYKEVKQENACAIAFSEEPVWYPIDHCIGFFALPPSDITALRTYQAKICQPK